VDLNEYIGGSLDWENRNLRASVRLRTA